MGVPLFSMAWQVNINNVEFKWCYGNYKNYVLNTIFYTQTHLRAAWSQSIAAYDEWLCRLAMPWTFFSGNSKVPCATNPNPIELDYEMDLPTTYEERTTKGWSSPALSNRLPLGDVQLLWNYGTVEWFFQCGYSAAGYPFWIPLRLLQKATWRNFDPFPMAITRIWLKQIPKQNIDFKMSNSAKWWVYQSENTLSGCFSSHPGSPVVSTFIQGGEPRA